jgi:hypothetical protein
MRKSDNAICIQSYPKVVRGNFIPELAVMRGQGGILFHWGRSTWSDIHWGELGRNLEGRNKE